MTIQFVGHIHSMERELCDKVAVKLRVEAGRSREDIVVIADKGEIGMYRIGMPIIVQIRPAPEAGVP